MISAAARRACLTVFTVLLGLQATAASAQEMTLEQRLAAAESLFDQLDNEAEACLQELETEAAEPAIAGCRQFLNTVDGERVAEYIVHCSVLTRWQEDFINSEPEDEQSAEALNRTVQRLRGVEYYCGEDALSRRTEFVQTAFDRLRGNGMASTLPAQAFRPDAGRAFPNQSIYQSQQRQRMRLRAETNRLWNDLEIELLRRQIERNRLLQRRP